MKRAHGPWWRNCLMPHRHGETDEQYAGRVDNITLKLAGIVWLATLVGLAIGGGR